MHEYIKSNVIQMGLNELDQKCVQIEAEKLMQSKTSGGQHTFGLTHEKKNI